MPYDRFKANINQEIENIRASGLYKNEKVLTGPQRPDVNTEDGETINFCANNYLGLANHPEILKAAEEGLRTRGYGMASVRFICGTQDIHQTLERRLSEFLGTEDTILYNSCFDANTGLFETVLTAEDALISDSLNHASIVDGVRLCKAKRLIYRHSDMTDLEAKLEEAQSARFRMIATDGVFSMQGDLALLPEICDLAGRHDALVMVDDSHATAFVGPNGRGTAEELGVEGRIDVITSTLGKALGGATGGFTAGRKEIVELLRQRSRTYLFSNTLAPPMVMASIRALEMVQEDPSLRETLWANTAYFRDKMSSLGFTILPGKHPIVPIMLGDELKTVELAKAVNDQGIFVVGFSFPVVPRGEARIRVQVTAAHTRDQLDRAVTVFEQAGRKVGVI